MSSFDINPFNIKSYYGGGCGRIGQTIYYLGGKINSNNQLNPSILSLNLNKGFNTLTTWQIKTPNENISIPSPLVKIRGKQYNDIYILGQQNQINNFYFYNVESNMFLPDNKSNLLNGNDLIFPELATWNTLPNDEDKFVLFGGYFKTLNNTNKEIEYDIAIYSNSQRDWSLSKSNEFYSRRSDHYSTIYNDDLYYMGGYFNKNKTMIPLDHLLKYNIKENSFTRISLEGDIPKPRIGATLTAIGNQLLLVGGSGDIGLTALNLNDYILDMKTFKWISLDINSSSGSNSIIGYRPCRINVQPYIIFSFGYNSGKNSLAIFDQNSMNYQTEYLPLNNNNSEQYTPLPLYLILIISLSVFLFALISIISIYLCAYRKKNKISKDQDKFDHLVFDHKFDTMEKELVIPEPIWEPTYQPLNKNLKLENSHLFSLKRDSSIKRNIDNTTNQAERTSAFSNTLVYNLDFDDLKQKKIIQ